jgi:hypothetical protein
MVREAFEVVLNLPIGKYGVPEYLAIYADKFLSKDAKVAYDEETKTKVEKVVILFSFLWDKDLFITVY